MDWDEWADSNVGITKKQSCFLGGAALLLSRYRLSIPRAGSYVFCLGLGERCWVC